MTIVVFAAIVSLSKQLGWESRAYMHAKYADNYGELASLISSERILFLMNDSTFTSVGDLI